MGAHAFFAPSSAPRVVLCPGSLLLTADMPDNQSVEAAEGTAAHWIGDLCLRTNRMVERYAACNVIVTKQGECRFQSSKSIALEDELVFEVDDEMINAVQEYVDWCNGTPGEHFPECRVDISKWCPQPRDDLSAVFVPAQAYEPQKGTSDHAACQIGRLIITDLKYGKGVKVYAENNYQAVLYALGFINEWDWFYEFDEIEIRICQPRLDHKDVWIITREEIEAIGRYILERFTLALEPNAPFAAGEKQCQFCKASGMCRAQKDHLSEIRGLAFEDLDQDFVVPDIRLLTNDELVEVFRVHKFYLNRFDAVVREMDRAGMNKVKFNGLKRVMSRTHRKWINETEAAAALELDIPRAKLFEESMISPSEAEKLVPKKIRGEVSKLAYSPRGGPCWVDESDKRPLYDDVVADEIDEAFDDLVGQS